MESILHLEYFIGNDYEIELLGEQFFIKHQNLLQIEIDGKLFQIKKYYNNENLMINKFSESLIGHNSYN